MAYDEDLADRVRALFLQEDLLEEDEGWTEKRMFGGLGFLVDGRLAVSASSRGGLLVRVDPHESSRLVRAAHVAPFEMRGRELDGWVRVDPEGVRTKRQLTQWVNRGVAFARSLPAKRARQA
jgi:TfoX/Sxy family transcriptional regulator of competence genes